jgi:hypothetical protein
VIVYDLDTIGVAILPFKTDTPPIVDTNAMLPCPIPAQFFQSVRRWNAQVIQAYGTVKHTQLTQGDLLNIVWQPCRTATVKNLGSFLAFEGSDHES